jgi:hypothetical protein
MSSINLNTLDRDSYVAFRAEWKTYYKELSARIRALKIEVKNTMRTSISQAGPLQNNLRYLQGEATEELEVLKNAKARLKEISAEDVPKAA